jgi:hypothetical protein
MTINSESVDDVDDDDDDHHHHHHHHHVVCSLSCYRSIVSHKANFPDSAIKCFLFKFPVVFVSLGLSIICLRLPRLPFPFIFPSITCFRRQFLRKM